MREKKRYMVFEIISEGQIKEFKSVADAIWDSSLQLIGELGTGEAGVWLMNDMWMPETQKGIIKVNNKYVDKLRVSMALVNEIEQQKVIVRSVGVSGTLKKARENFLAS